MMFFAMLPTGRPESIPVSTGMRNTWPNMDLRFLRTCCDSGRVSQRTYISSLDMIPIGQRMPNIEQVASVAAVYFVKRNGLYCPAAVVVQHTWDNRRILHQHSFVSVSLTRVSTSSRRTGMRRSYEST